MGTPILHKEELAPGVMKFVIKAPEIAAQVKAGQFLILRVHEKGERVPLSIPEADPQSGNLTLVSQEVGKTSAMLNELEVGDEIHDVAGPLGRPTHIEKFGTVLAVGGGVGIAPLYPIAHALKQADNYVVSILGGRSKPFVIMEQEMRSVSDEVFICTDDGSYGEKGFVSHVLKGLLDQGRRFDFCITVGPPIMMRVICDITRPYNIKTQASLNTIMIDGTGMCGACRVSVGGETKFVCVDGPEFDGHEVDFDLMMKRLAMYRAKEERAYRDYLESRKKREK